MYVLERQDCVVQFIKEPNDTMKIHVHNKFPAKDLIHVVSKQQARKYYMSLLAGDFKPKEIQND